MKDFNEVYEEMTEDMRKRYDSLVEDNIPKRFRDTSFEDIDEKLKDFYSNREEGEGLFVWGDIGTGKTHSIYALIKKRQQDKICKKYEEFDYDMEDFSSDITGRIFSLYIPSYSMPEVLYRIRAAMNDKEDDFLERISGNKKVLFIDDIGVEKLSDWVLETFYYIINSRYEQELPTFLTSNYSLDELSDRIGDRIPSRIAEMCRVIKLEGSDKRLNHANTR